jgi:hypothetical protein
MLSNRDAGDVASLEEVFRSHEFGRAADAWGDGEVSDPTGREDVILAKEFGRRLTAVPRRDVEDEAERRPPARDDGLEGSEQPLEVAPSDGGAGLGEEHPEAPSPEPSRRPTGRYWTIAFVGALVALVAAGITTGAGQRPRASVSAHGEHGTALPGGGFRAPRAASTGSTPPAGSLTAAAGSGGLSSGAGTEGGLGSGNAPGGRVSLVGPATFTATPASPAASGNAGGGSGGTPGSPPPPGSTNPVAPVASALGSAVSAVGSSVTTAMSQIGGSVPAAGSTTGVVNTVVNTLDQAVGAPSE